MKFGNPPMLIILPVAVGLLSVFLFFAWRKRQRDMGLFVRSRLLANLTVGLKPALQKLRMILLVASVGCLMFALARPQWGFTLEELKQSGLDIVVALDTSKSMSTQDVVPSRMARAKLAALELMPLAKTDRLGLVAFAGTAFLQCPLTVDDEAYRQSLNLIDVGFIPQGGTAIGEAIRVALKAFKEDENNEKAIILITDGEDHEEGVMGSVEAAEKAGVRIFTIGVGTAQGELIPTKDEKNGGPFVKDEEGNVVKSHLDEALLQRVAKGTQGFYLPLKGANTMDLLYERGLAPLLGQIRMGGIPTGEKRPARILKHYQERFQWPLGVGIALLILEIFLPVKFRFKSRRKVTTAAVAAIFVLNVITTMAASDKALDLYNKGNYPEALKEYQRLQKKNPKDDRLPFNTGTTAYQAKDYERAITELEQATTSQNLALQENAYYNLGNAYYRFGEKAPEAKEKMGAWEEAMKHYESALKLNPQDKEAKNNVEFVKKALEELKKQPPQQSQDPNKDDKNKDKKEDSKDQKSSDSNKQDQKQNQPDKEQKSPQDSEKKPTQEQNQKKDEQSSEGQKPDSEKKEKTEQKPAPSEQKGPTNQTAQAQSGKPDGKMTPQQARQLLDSQKEGEKAMNFVPQQKPKSAGFKDW